MSRLVAGEGGVGGGGDMAEECLEVAGDEVGAGGCGDDGEAAAVAVGSADASCQAAVFEPVDDLGDAAACDGEATAELAGGEALAVVGEVVQGGVFGGGHVGAGAAGRGELVRRQQQLVEEGGRGRRAWLSPVGAELTGLSEGAL
jgi:hypothetical protein